jgi:hypothetical protein
VIEHNVGFGADGLGVALPKGFELLLRSGVVEKRIVCNRFLDFVVAFVGGVVASTSRMKPSSMACFME